jgi:arylsulfatase A-like enzyme
MLALLLSLPLALSPASTEDPRPNIVWITVEDMSPWLGCYSDGTVPTPNVDSLAARGTRFTHAYATTPVCAPSRSTLITGCYATSIGSMHMRTGSPSSAAIAANPEAYANIPSYEAVPPPSVRCFPELLRRAGYYCTNNSKTDYQFKAPATTWNASGKKAHWKHRPDPDQPFFAVFNTTLTHESGTFKTKKRQPRITDPAAVSIPPYYPDTPTVRDDLARTYDNIAAMDRWVGKLLAELDSADLLDNTIILYFSDHGVGLPRGKRCIYDSGTHVPLILVQPGATASVSERVVSFVDFAATTLSLANLKPPDWMQGRAFAGPHATAPHPYAYIHADRMDAETDRTRAITDGRHRYIRNYRTDLPRLYPVAYAERIPMTADIHTLRASGEANQAQWQLVNPTKPAEELYDTEHDPHEIHNLIGTKGTHAIHSSLSAALDQWIEATGDLGLLPEGEMVTTRLWNGATSKPRTAPPRLTRNAAGQLTLTSDTPGASIGIRSKDNKSWHPAPTPLVLDPRLTYRAIAHRIGFKPSKPIALDPDTLDALPR